jgi:hypothetical protein
MNVFTLSPYEIINAWKNLRDDLNKDKEQTLKGKLLRVNNFWWNCPFVNYSLNIEKPEEWPTPWELIFENQYDHVARSYMIAETLLLSEICDLDKNSVELILIKDIWDNSFKVVVKADNYILGYENKNIIDYDQFLREGHTIILSYKKNNDIWQ